MFKVGDKVRRKIEWQNKDNWVSTSIKECLSASSILTVRNVGGHTYNDDSQSDVLSVLIRFKEHKRDLNADGGWMSNYFEKVLSPKPLSDWM